MHTNLHHLELFYYVARCGGITAATRGMPYSIQQPAISHQMRLLEDALELTLFERRPFRLTPAGRSLYDFCRTFFDHVDDLVEGLRDGGQMFRLRLAASRIVLREYLPGPLQRVREQFSPLAFSLASPPAAEMLHLLATGEIDLAISVVDGALPTGLKRTRLASLTYALAVKADSPWQDAHDLLASGASKEHLLDLPNEEPLSRIFHRAIEPLGIIWRSRLELDSFDILLAYVAQGFGVGVTLLHPTPPKGVRLLPLHDFPKANVYGIWRSRQNPVMQALLQDLKAVGSDLQSLQ